MWKERRGGGKNSLNFMTLSRVEEEEDEQEKSLVTTTFEKLKRNRMGNNN